MDQETRKIRDEIARDREELVGTVQSLAAKADVKGRLKEAVSDNAARLHERADELSHRVKEAVPEAGEAIGSATAEVRRRVPRRSVPLAAAAALLGVLLWRRRPGSAAAR